MGTSYLSKLHSSTRKAAPLRARRARIAAAWVLALFLVALSIGLAMWFLGISVPSWGYGRPDAY